MAVLPDADRVRVWKAMMEDLSRRRDAADFTKDELRAAVDALDDWVDANAAAVNAALPLEFRTNASQAQKALLLQFVVQRRYLVGV